MRSLLVLALLLTAPVAAAQVPRAPDISMPGQGEPQLEDWVRDLESNRRADRLLAARELRRMARAATRLTEHRDPFRAEVAAVELADIATAAGPAARRSLVTHADVRRPCADLLALLGDPLALPDLREALATEERKGVRKHIERAIDSLQGAP